MSRHAPPAEAPRKSQRRRTGRNTLRVTRASRHTRQSFDVPDQELQFTVRASEFARFGINTGSTDRVMVDVKVPHGRASVDVVFRNNRADRSSYTTFVRPIRDTVPLPIVGRDAIWEIRGVYPLPNYLSNVL